MASSQRPHEPAEAADGAEDVARADPTSFAAAHASFEAALARVVASATFRRSQRHRDFLDHVVRASIAGRHESLREIVIGLEVFGRSPQDYDPRRDPIVRVEAGRIREKLARYYATEGAADAFAIVLRVGSYAPRLIRREARVVHAHALRSIAVLPFDNLSRHVDDDALCLGLADVLIDTLGRVEGLKVVARMSAFKARERATDPADVGKVLGVAHLVHGSCQRSGRRLRCFARVLRVRDATPVWSQRFEFDLDASGSDLFACEDRIADAMLVAVSALDRVDPAAAPSTVSSRIAPSNSREARELFERGRTLAQERTHDGYRRAIELLEQALAIEPSFSQACSLLATAYGNVIGFLAGDIAPVVERSRITARRAMEIDPLDGEARAVIAALAHRFDYDWPRAEALYREALRLAPSSPFVHASYASGLCFHGRFDEAARHIQTAFDLDPLNLGTRVNRAFIHACARRNRSAVDEFEAILQVEPRHLTAHVQLGLTHLWSGCSKAALDHFDVAAGLAPDHPLAPLYRIAAIAQRGDGDAARASLETHLAGRPADRRSHFTLAMVYACLDDPMRALAALDDAGRHGDFWFASYPVVPLFDPYRPRADFEAFRARYRLDTVKAFATDR